MSHKIAYRFRVFGVVQGVAYRYSAQRQAEVLGVSGWIRNLIDGGVEGFVEGDIESVKNFLKWCKNGPPNASVEQLLIEESPILNLSGFEIKY